MKDSIGEKELLGAIEFAYGCKRLKEQAYAQLVEIVEEYYGDPNNKSLGKLAQEYGVSYSLVHAIDARVRADMGQSGEVDEELIQWLDGEYISLGHAAGMCDPSDPEDVEHSEKLRKEQKVVMRIKQRLTQNAALHKELKSLEEESFREEVDDGKALGWLDKLEDALATDNDSDYREAKSKLTKLLTHLSTSGNDMSGKRVVTREWVVKWREELLMRGMPGRDISELSIEQICEELGIEVEPGE